MKWWNQSIIIPFIKIICYHSTLSNAFILRLHSRRSSCRKLIRPSYYYLELHNNNYHEDEDGITISSNNSNNITSRQGFAAVQQRQRRNVLISLLQHASSTLLLPLAYIISFTSSSSAAAAATNIEEPNECQNGKIVLESAVPGAYQQTCMNLDERTFHLQSIKNTPGSDDNIITVYQGTNSGAGEMAGRTGGM